MTGDDMSASDRFEDQRTTRNSRGAVVVGSPNTSAAAVFALVFGLSSLFIALLALLAPLAVVFGLIGLVLLLGVALPIGATVFINPGGLDQLELQDVRGEIPTEPPEP
jgi:hypothetical protein